MRFYVAATAFTPFLVKNESGSNNVAIPFSTCFKIVNSVSNRSCTWIKILVAQLIDSVLQRNEIFEYGNGVLDIGYLYFCRHWRLCTLLLMSCSLSPRDVKSNQMTFQSFVLSEQLENHVLFRLELGNLVHVLWLRRCDSPLRLTMALATPRPGRLS